MVTPRDGDRLDRDPHVPLRELRVMAGMSQVELAEAMGVGQGEISRLEARTDAKWSTIEKYVRALGGGVDLVVRFGDRELRVCLGERA